VLTPAGERLLVSARDVLDRLDRTEDEIRQMGKDRAGILRITTECYTCYHWLPPLLVHYRKRFPRVEVRIDVGATGRPLDMLLAGKIDLAIMSSPVNDRRLVSRPVFDDELVVVAARHHPFAKQTHVRLSEMRDQTLYVYPPKEESRVLQEVLLPSGHVPARIEEVTLTESIAELVKAGLGVSVLARWAVQPLLEAGTLVARPLTAHGLHREWRAVLPKDLARADYIGEFIDLLVKHAPTARASRKPA